MSPRQTYQNLVVLTLVLVLNTQIFLALSPVNQVVETFAPAEYRCLFSDAVQTALAFVLISSSRLTL